MKYLRVFLLLTGFLCLFACRKVDEPTFVDVDPTVDLKEGKVKVYRVNIEGTLALLDAASSTFTVTFPTVTDFTSMSVSFTTDATDIIAGNRHLSPTSTGVDLSSPLTVRFVQNDVYQDYTVVVRNTGLPVVRVETPGHKAITSKEVWMDDATVRIEWPDGRVDYEGVTEIRGRGNSTWDWYPKKPYALRLREKGEILGMPSHKRWILLANWKDRTILRNDAAFWLSRHTGLPYTVRGQFVELVLNGVHKGNYYLCEQIKLNKKRIDIEKMDSQETDPVKITGGYLLEVDTYFNEKYKFQYWDLFGIPWMVKEPDDDELSTAAFNYIKGWIRDLETLMKNTANVQEHAYEEFLDVDTAIDYMIVEELTGNHDFYNTWPANGAHSAYLYKERGGKLYHGPVWDFDYHTFCPDRTTFWAGANKTLLYPALLKDEKFRNRMIERWDLQKDELKKLPEYIDEQVERLRLSESYNAAMWPISNRENGDETMTFQQSVDRMKQAFLDKWSWMDKNIRNLR